MDAGGSPDKLTVATTLVDESNAKADLAQSQDLDLPTSGTNTPSHAPTPASSAVLPLTSKDSNHPTPIRTISSTKSSNKKGKAPDKDDEEDSKSMKRGKISYGRD